MEWRAGMIRRREESGLGRLGIGGLRGSNRVGVTVSRCERILLLAQGHLSTSISPSSLPIVFSLRRVYTPIKVVEREGRWVICSFWCVSKVFDAFVLVAWYFFAEWILYTRSTA